MNDEFDKTGKPNDIDDFLNKFDKISNVFDRSLNKTEHQKETFDKASNLNSALKPGESTAPSNDLTSGKTRMERLSESKPQTLFSSINDKLNSTRKDDPTRNEASSENNGNARKNSEDPMTNQKKKKKHKYTVNKKQLIKFILFTGLAIGLILGAIVISIIVKTPPIEPDNIYSLLSENSILYDDEGNIVDSLLTSDGLRTNVSYTDLPQNLVDSFVSIEDKTFWDHNGFNFVRIVGAIKEGVMQGDSISGTSTITQQLARNLYLAETKSDYSFTRKIKEAYYTVLLERHLSKKQILEAYLNTIFLGYGTNGVQAASQAYFSKDVQDLTLAECAALASLPQAPDRYALVKRYEAAQVTDDDPNLIRKGETYSLVYNDTFTDRKNLVLSFMLSQEKISQTEYDEAMATDIRASINPSQDTSNEISSYFADYVIDDVAKGLMKEYDVNEDEAKQMIYNNGLKIYTTMNSKMQKIVEREFSNNDNFPDVTGLKKDGAGNILNSTGKVLLHKYENYFNEDGTFTLTSDEYKATDDGGLILMKGKRLNFYSTEVQGKTDYSVEFKDLYIIQDGVFYSINGGVISIPQEFKTKDDDGNLVISGEFFKKNPDVLQFVPDGISVSNKNYILKQRVVQPQSAMVIFDYKNGGIKAMVGGRNTEGRMLFNRATSPRQPGSSIKPMGVYGPALEDGLKKANSGITNGTSEGNTYGQLWTAASVIDDAPLYIQGKLWPKNWYSGYRGLQTMRQSIEQSINVNAVKIFTDIGVDNSVNFLKKCGVSSIVESGDVNDMNAAALALGGMSRGISPLEMVAGYGAFANQGNYTEPISYTKVTNKRGEVILENSAAQERIMDEGVAFIMTNMLHTVVTNGIAGSAAIGSQPVAGKTGTTSDNYDAWFVGFTPQYAASVWIGNDTNVELSQGSVSAAKIWSKIMKQVHEGLEAGSFPSAPSNVISVAVDTKSGRLPSELSILDPRGTVRNEYFIRGTEPTTSDNVHVTANICTDSGYLATPYCSNITSKVFVKRLSSDGSSVGDSEFELPAYYCNLHNLDTTTYPINPDAVLNQDFVWDGTITNPDGSVTDPTDPGTDTNNGNDGNNDNNGNNDNTNPDDGSEPPDWLNFFD